MADESPGDGADGSPRSPEGDLEPTQQLSPLSIQAAALVRSIESLSNIFWISIGGTFLTIFFSGLSRLEVNATTDYIYLGEYQVPKSILPLASLLFSLFAFWLSANRLHMLSQVLATTRLPRTMVHEIFHLNPPVLHVFDRNNADRWAPFSGFSVLTIIWAVFFGNSIALTLSSAAQQGASFAEFDAPLLSLYALLTVVAVVYGVRAFVPPLRRIIGILHGLDFHFGWPRVTAAFAVMLLVAGLNNINQIFSPSEQQDDLLGPGIANAIDGNTLFMLGTEIKMFGIDAMQPDQICQNAAGEDYPCGRLATQALQALVQERTIVCLPLFALAEHRVVGTCRIISDDRPTPTRPEDFLTGDQPNDLSRLQVLNGHALGVGIGGDLLEAEQNQAQAQRKGIWQGSFTPPWLWRARQN